MNEAVSSPSLPLGIALVFATGSAGIAGRAIHLLREVEPHPSRALQFGVLAWILGAINVCIPVPDYPPSGGIDFNFGPHGMLLDSVSGIMLLLLWAIGALISFFGGFLSLCPSEQISLPKRGLAFLLAQGYLSFVVLSFSRGIEIACF